MFTPIRSPTRPRPLALTPDQLEQVERVARLLPLDKRITFYDRVRAHLRLACNVASARRLAGIGKSLLGG